MIILGKNYVVVQSHRNVLKHDKEEGEYLLAKAFQQDKYS